MMKPTTAHSSLRPDRVSLGRFLCKPLVLCSTLALIILLCFKSLDAQPPAANTPAATPPESNLPDVPNFDIDLGTDEFENFGEEGFQVEEKLSPATETTVTVIKVAVGAAIVLLFGFIVMKLLRRKGADGA
ncbi:MAG: hypothetical protein KDA51_15070 [Planctomycetales bacterium]|nr:hypothetical protein [Planctomycetales bacterium]